SEEHTSELQSHHDLVCRLLLEKKKRNADGDSRTHQSRHSVHWAVFAGHVEVNSRRLRRIQFSLFFFFNDTATTEIYTLSLHDALPISARPRIGHRATDPRDGGGAQRERA